MFLRATMKLNPSQHKSIFQDLVPAVTNGKSTTQKSN